MTILQKTIAKREDYARLVYSGSSHISYSSDYVRKDVIVETKRRGLSSWLKEQGKGN